MSTKKHQENKENNSKNSNQYGDINENIQKIEVKNKEIQEKSEKIENRIKQIEKGDIVKIKYETEDEIKNPILLVRSKIYNRQYKIVLGSGGSEIIPYGIIKKEKDEFYLKRKEEKYSINSVKII